MSISMLPPCWRLSSWLNHGFAYAVNNMLTLAKKKAHQNAVNHQKGGEGWFYSTPSCPGSNLLFAYIHHTGCCDSIWQHNSTFDFSCGVLFPRAFRLGKLHTSAYAALKNVEAKKQETQTQWGFNATRGGFSHIDLNRSWIHPSCTSLKSVWL